MSTVLVVYTEIVWTDLGYISCYFGNEKLLQHDANSLLKFLIKNKKSDHHLANKYRQPVQATKLTKRRYFNAKSYVIRYFQPLRGGKADTSPSKNSLAM